MATAHTADENPSPLVATMADQFDRLDDIVNDLDGEGGSGDSGFGAMQTDGPPSFSALGNFTAGQIDDQPASFTFKDLQSLQELNMEKLGKSDSLSGHSAAMDLAPAGLSFQGLNSDDNLTYGDMPAGSPIFKFGNPSPMKRELDQWNLGAGLTPTAGALSSGFTPTAGQQPPAAFPSSPQMSASAASPAWKSMHPGGMPVSGGLPASIRAQLPVGRGRGAVAARGSAAAARAAAAAAAASMPTSVPPTSSSVPAFRPGSAGYSGSGARPPLAQQAGPPQYPPPQGHPQYRVNMPAVPAGYPGGRGSGPVAMVMANDARSNPAAIQPRGRGGRGSRGSRGSRGGGGRGGGGGGGGGGDPMVTGNPAAQPFESAGTSRPEPLKRKFNHDEALEVRSTLTATLRVASAGDSGQLQVMANSSWVMMRLWATHSKLHCSGR